MNIDSQLLLAVQLTIRMVSSDEPVTSEAIAANAELVIAMLRKGGQGADLLLEDVIREVESRCSVFVPSSSYLTDARDHVEWLANRRGDIDWRSWEHYQRWLSTDQDLEPMALRRLDDNTSQVLGFLEDPKRPGAWDRRGMVVGQVQSGKTSHYIGLITKAVDAGYRLIVVLAGLHNSLRSQTQLRLDLGLLGYDSQRRMLSKQTVRLGVGAMSGSQVRTLHGLTNSSEKGDFKLSVAKSNVMVGGSDPILLVVKKNKSILENLIKWATFLAEHQTEHADRSVVRNVPMLVIDDEADNASVNTRERADPNDPEAAEYEPSVINGLIRKLLVSFDQSAYVGYTATPFANIFIYKDEKSERFGEDLFPRSFIVRLQPPDTYFGPLTVFGTEADATTGLEATTGLPITRAVTDNSTWIPDNHKSDLTVGPLPESLRRAIKSFVLVCAARAARGQIEVHNSMLVHVTRYTNVQTQVYELVREELEYLQQRLKRGDGGSSNQLIDDLRQIWEDDFLPTTARIDGNVPAMPWQDVADQLHGAASKIEMRKINGTARDALEYYEHRNGLSVIAIGGDKLSRGLTLEGLSVSYYLRATRMYDTLMQMGRWFGYRPSYTDLCRLYTTEELRNWYRDITLANEELLLLLDEMASLNATPEEFGLKVRSHPDGLMVTAAAKMRNGEKVMLSFAGTIPETLLFDLKDFVVRGNFQAGDDLIRRLGGAFDQPESKGTYVWTGVDPKHILDFITRYRPHRDAGKVQTEPIRRYIETRVKAGELIHWTVALISIVDAEVHTKIGGVEVGLVRRKSDREEALKDERYVLRRMISPTDEAIDFSPALKERALDLTRQRWVPGRTRSGKEPDVASGLVLRELRPKEFGLILIYPLEPGPAGRTGDPIIGYAISFPGSSDAGAIQYVVNNVYYQQELGLE